MSIKTYRAKSPSEALALVKKDIGPDAVILHTRTYKAGGVMGIGARTITEITATTGAAAGASPAPRAGSSNERDRKAARQALEAKPSSSASATSDSEARREHQHRAALLRDAVELSSNARKRSREANPTAPMPAAKPATPTTLVLEPDPEPAVPAVESRAEHRSRLEELYLEPAPSPVETPEPKPSITIERTPEPPAMDPPSHEAANPEMAAELADLKRMMGQVLRSSRSNGGSSYPEALAPIADALEEAELGQELADRVLSGVLEELDAQELRDPEVVRQVALRRLAALIPVDGTLARATPPASGGPLVIALVGPTGVGKTTTIAKLAATYKLRHGRSVGLVTSDTYRIAAVDQLRTYANIIGLPIKVTLTPAEMAQAVRGFNDHDVVLLDTAGRSQHDASRIDELRAFLDVARPHHTQLVLSTTSGAGVIRRIAKVFGGLDPTHVIATKLDEAVALGPVVEAVRELKAPVSFVTTGQEVPDQIETACAERFARRLLACAPMGAESSNAQNGGGA